MFERELHGRRPTFIAAVLLALALLCLLGRGCGEREPADPNAELARLAGKAVTAATRAQESERSTLMAVDRWYIVAVVLAALVPIVVSYLVLRESCRREPGADEVVEEIARLTLPESDRQRLAVPPDRGRLAPGGEPNAHRPSEDA